MSAMGYGGKAVVVTGAATGVGAALLDVLDELGAEDVTVIDRKQPTGPHARYIEADLSDEAQVDVAAQAVGERVDVLFNNAGVNSTAGDRTTIAVNYLALRRLSERLIERMPAGGAIVNTASIAGGQWPSRAEAIGALLDITGWNEALDWVDAHRDLFTDSYPFSKEIVQLWTLRSSRSSWLRQVRTNSVCPAPIDTPLLADFRSTMTDKVIDWNISQAMGRVMTPAEVAWPLAFLGSDAASYLNGVNLLADGGFTAAMTTNQVDFTGLA